MSATPHLDALSRDGFVVIRNLLNKHQLLGAKAASKYITDGARKGKWPYIRTVPKQYPPWPTWDANSTTTHNIWGVQHLLHPDMSVRDTFAELYFSDEVLDVVKQLVGLSDDPDADDKLVMELFNLLVSPDHGEDFQLCWHRDDVRPDVGVEEEARQLAEKGAGEKGAQLHAQYNIALFEDASLIVVPGSHRRVRTDVERNADPYEQNMPGQLVVELQPGDAVFYNSNILHRGAYKGVEYGKDLGRMTLHGSVGLAGHGNERARQVLQHAVGEWVDRAEFSTIEGRKGDRAEAMRKRLMAMGKGENLGYSLQG
jgi:ectoine hydroxylase-related dioxygenase (phytanoyl-CoA dioxygenase family)